jgi:pilus assembly protein Flp/PilA
MSKIKSLFARLARDERGAAMVEYSILIGLISAALIVIIAAIATWIVGRWTALQAALGA